VHDLFIFIDEIYEYFVYDNLAHVSLASQPDWQTAQSPFLGIPKRLASQVGGLAMRLQPVDGPS
jgi:hypothetical protein